jgi:hypothetical protein
VVLSKIGVGYAGECVELEYANIEGNKTGGSGGLESASGLEGLK